MAEGGPTTATSSAAGAGGDAPSRMSSSFVKVGDRTRFTVELRPGETTIVSWKKLLKDATKENGGASSSSVAAVAAPIVPTIANPSLESLMAPGQHAANELKDAAPPNRFGAVIEKIEHLYMGRDSSDDEDLDDVPDDDQYDTEDSFIDDEELDEYFEVDKSKTKHNGYFVNRGVLEKETETLETLDQQSRKRRRKEMAKGPGDNHNRHGPNKHMKVDRKGAGKFASLVEKNILPFIHNQSNASGTSHQKMAGDGKPLSGLSPSLRTSDGDASSFLIKSSDKQKNGMLPAKNPCSNLKENNNEEPDIMMQLKDRNDMREKIDLNFPDVKNVVLPVKSSLVHKKEGSSLKAKTNSLEKAIRELEKMVVELRPPAGDAQDADASTPIKRRLPREIKLKLAKVARLANASNGKVSKELLNRLMGILGHLCQIRTLKRHLKVMITTNLSTKQEKDDKCKQIKKEVIELIRARIPSLASKGTAQQIEGSCGVQGFGNSDKALKGQLYIDATLEDRICDLYDIFVDGLDEDAAPQVRKLYAELAKLWPSGVMDNHGIKRAICHAKERKRSLNERKKQDQAKIKRKVLTSKTQDSGRVESSVLAQLQHVELNLATEPGNAAVQQIRPISSTTGSAAVTVISSTGIAAVSVPQPSADVSKPNHEKVKGAQNNSLTGVRIAADGMATKKKIKKRTEITGEGHLRPDTEITGEGHLRPDKLTSHRGDHGPKQQNHTATPLLGAPPSQVTMNSDLSHRHDR